MSGKERKRRLKARVIGTLQTQPLTEDQPVKDDEDPFCLRNRPLSSRLLERSYLSRMRVKVSH
jgi:hypothetical protein